jgi:nitrite reductase/ring-hydroxylating ferredoxin subunit
MSAFHTVAKVGQIPEGEGRSFVVEQTMVAVFQKEGSYFAINDVCPHMGASLGEGFLEGDQVICPWHAWRFCIKDGVWMDNPRSKTCTPTYPVRIEGDEIQVQVPAS